MLGLLLVTSLLIVFGQCQLSCRYEHPTRGVIDLSTVGRQNGIARFHDLAMSTSATHVFSFNPCYSFSEDECKNVAACRITKDRKVYDVLGLQSHSSWTVDSDGNAVLVYNETHTTLSIIMMCSPNNQDTLELIGEGPVNRFRMVLKSPCACWNGCAGSRSTKMTTEAIPSITPEIIQWDSCRYSDSEKGVIDLSQVGKVHGKPRFKNIQDQNVSSIVWSYNPCFSFNQKKCHHVAACRINKADHTSVSIAVQETTSWIYMNENDETKTPAIVYDSGMLGQKRLKVELICNNATSKHHLEVFGETSQSEYLMRLTSPCACWNGCDGRTDSFRWKFWMSLASAALLSLSCACCIMMCCACSKPKRKRRTLLVNEKTPLYA